MAKKTYKKPMEFMQKIVIISIAVSVFVVLYLITGNFILIIMDKPSVAQETVTAITVFGGILSGLSASAYATLNAIRTWSLNKHCHGIMEGENNENRLEAEIKQPEILDGGSGMGNITYEGYRYGR